LKRGHLVIAKRDRANLEYRIRHAVLTFFLALLYQGAERPLTDGVAAMLYRNNGNGTNPRWRRKVAATPGKLYPCARPRWPYLPP
jgi:hypothetical protein